MGIRKERRNRVQRLMKRYNSKLPTMLIMMLVLSGKYNVKLSRLTKKSPGSFPNQPSPLPSLGNLPISERIMPMATIPKPIMMSIFPSTPNSGMAHFTNSSAICTAFKAAPFRKLSATTHRLRPLGMESSSRIRPTNTASVPAASI